MRRFWKVSASTSSVQMVTGQVTYMKYASRSTSADTIAVAVKYFVIFHNRGVKERVTLRDEENDRDTDKTYPVTTTTMVGKE